MCLYDVKLTNIGNIEIINLTISDKNMSLYELNNKLKIAREYGFIFNQIIRFTMKFYSILSQTNTHYYLKLQIPMKHRQFFKILTQNLQYVQTHCNDRGIFFHFQVENGINMIIHNDYIEIV